jgi:hypothetical protein
LCEELIGELRRGPLSRAAQGFVGGSTRDTYWTRSRRAMMAAQSEFGRDITPEITLAWAHEQSQFGKLPRKAATFKRYLRRYRE